MKRVIALLLTLVMLLGLVPTALAAEAAAPDGTVVKAEEVSGTPRLDAMAAHPQPVPGLCQRLPLPPLSQTPLPPHPAGRHGGERLCGGNHPAHRASAR